MLTNNQNEKLINYLLKDSFHCKRFGSPEDADFLLAFSFGQNPDVNIELATIVQKVNGKFNKLKVVAQWEIAV
ncbi:MAG: hypothetical protein K8S16_01915 [Bacteroidales bacterium]|nr:hypothetical protein [Bacteroidales bacterium]